MIGIMSENKLIIKFTSIDYLVFLMILIGLIFIIFMPISKIPELLVIVFMALIMVLISGTLIYKSWSSIKPLEDHIPIEERRKAQIPELLSKNISESEEIIYFLQYKYGQRQLNSLQKFYIGALTIFTAFIVGFIISSGGHIISIGMDYGLYLLFITMFILINKVSLLFEASLLFTDKKIYFFRPPLIDSLDLASLNAIVFFKKKSQLDNDIGNIHFTPDHIISRKISYTLSDVPDFKENRKLIESLVFVHANIQERYQHIRQKLQIQFPYTIEISRHIPKFSHFNKIELHSAKIILFGASGSEEISFNDIKTLDFYQSKPTIGIYWNKDIDCLNINTSFYYKRGIKVGIFQNFPDVYEAIFCAYYQWKSKNSLLLSKEALDLMLKKLSIKYKEEIEETLVNTEEKKRYRHRFKVYQ